MTNTLAGTNHFGERSYGQVASGQWDSGNCRQHFNTLFKASAKGSNQSSSILKGITVKCTKQLSKQESKLKSALR